MNLFGDSWALLFNMRRFVRKKYNSLKTKYAFFFSGSTSIKKYLEFTNSEEVPVVTPFYVSYLPLMKI